MALFVCSFSLDFFSRNCLYRSSAADGPACGWISCPLSNAADAWLARRSNPTASPVPRFTLSPANFCSAELFALGTNASLG